MNNWWLHFVGCVNTIVCTTFDISRLFQKTISINLCFYTWKYIQYVYYICLTLKHKESH